MAKFHVNSKGQPALCSATQKACPLGGEHYDSMEDAATAAMERDQQLLRDAGIDLDALAKAKEEVGLTGVRNEDGSLMEFISPTVAQADGSQAEVVATDTNKGTGETFYQTADGFWHKQDEVESAEPAIPQEWQSVLETQKREAVLSVYGNTDPQAMSDYLTRPEVEAMTLDQFKEHLEELARTSGKNEGRLPIGARGHRYGSTREGKEEAARLQEIASLERKSRVAELLAQNADSKKEAIQHRNEKVAVESQISHLKEQQEIHKARKAHRAGKEIDPQMLEALKRKFMKKFKMPFEESGLSVGDLLQMAQKGEL